MSIPTIIDPNLQDLLEVVYTGKQLSIEQTNRLFTAMLQGQLNPEQISAVLIGLKARGESSQEITGAAMAMRNAALNFPRPDGPFSDIVGTGGDGHNTINISSAAALVAAAAGVKVAKHGNKSVSSKSGSSDLFASFGLSLMITPESARRCLDNSNFCFLAAPRYHAGMAHVMPVREKLKTRTLFNILGPLANPAMPTHGVYGVYRPELLQPYADVLQNMGLKKALVVHGSGVDEIALHGTTQAILIDNSTSEGPVQTVMNISHSDFGAKSFPLEDLVGGTPDENKAMIELALNGNGKEAHIHAIAANAAALLWLNGKADTLKDCFELALSVMQSGKALEVINTAAAISQEV